MQSRVRSARRQFELQTGQEHAMLLNIIEMRTASSITQIKAIVYDTYSTYFKQKVYHKAQKTGWTEILLKKDTQEEDELITLTPYTLWFGLAKIGGYFAFLNIAVIALRMLHHHLMNKELRQYLRKVNGQHRKLSKQDLHESIMDEEVEDEVAISEFFSFEQFTLMNREL